MSSQAEEKTIQIKIINAFVFINISEICLFLERRRPE
jgi:hypothetical protein